ncbi:MAG: adenylosuccinate synthase [Bacteroidales bacterium OttesenSCG-928-I14]|jgi:adenylosuccinate synthase|nr:adenylosuccinate synthase [Bacteroidales bacterium OttesenSCG-928-I14]
MKISVLVGLQWGDEGKGKMIDVLTPEYDIIARFQGGPNAGHTLLFNGEKCVLCSIPSGIFHGKKNVIGNGMVLDPVLFRSEIEMLSFFHLDLTDNIYISRRAHLILPTHRLLDKAYEAQKGVNKIGTTGKGIGPAYMDKVSRNGLRIGDIDCDFEKKYIDKTYRHKKLLQQMNFKYDLASIEKEWVESIEIIKQFNRIDTDDFINKALNKGETVLAEGAQGTMLDVDFGSYPFVTSSNTVCAGACIGLGVSPTKIGDVFGIFKAYCTRVGSGPFPTELSDSIGEKLRSIGNEYGSVTGRSRRCGWIDLVALRYAIIINGVTQLIMTKSDVLDSFEIVKICIAYEINGRKTKKIPFEINSSVKPVYKELPGWKTNMSNVDSEDKFPKAFEDYLEFLEVFLEKNIKIVSVGPGRNQTIVRNKLKQL